MDTYSFAKYLVFIDENRNRQLDKKIRNEIFNNRLPIDTYPNIEDSDDEEYS